MRETSSHNRKLVSVRRSDNADRPPYHLEMTSAGGESKQSLDHDGQNALITDEVIEIREAQTAPEKTLDTVYAFLADGEVAAGMDRLHRELKTIRNRFTHFDWKEFVEARCRTYRLCDLLHTCPVSNRCYHKPRGYAGDAVLLDMIYDQVPIDVSVLSPLAVSVFNYLTDT